MNLKDKVVKMFTVLGLLFLAYAEFSTGQVLSPDRAGMAFLMLALLVK